MQVTVNGEPIDYTLEGERSLGEVVAGIERWLNEGGLVVTSLRLGEREIGSVPESEWATTPVDGIPRLDIIARSPVELEREQIALISSYLEQLDAGLAGKGSLPADLLKGITDAAATTRRRLGLRQGSEAASTLAELEQLLTGAAPETVRSWPQGIRTRALDAIAGLREAVRARWAEIERPAEALQAAAGELAGSSRELAEVSLLLQTGQDELAMRRIGRFADVLQSVLRTAGRLSRESAGPPLVQGRPLQEFVQDLNAVLTQAGEALAARDTVLLGDLLEYEIAPRLESLSASLRGPEA